MEIKSLKIAGLKLIIPKLFQDERGYFFENFHYEKFLEAGIDLKIMQQNRSKSKKRIIRGLHYQVVNPQGKLVTVLSGEINDVAVDLRRSSPTFLKWQGVILNDENKYSLWIPPGFAHGFYVRSNWAEVEYSTSDLYNPAGERTILWNDPQLNINWGIEDGTEPVLSDKDRKGLILKDAEFYE